MAFYSAYLFYFARTQASIQSDMSSRRRGSTAASKKKNRVPQIKKNGGGGENLQKNDGLMGQKEASSIWV
jgi:hypothetical protein